MIGRVFTAEEEQPGFVLLGSVAFVLLIACANVANLLLSRSAARRKEMAIRAAIGAGRARVIKLLLTESMVLAVLGGLAGLLLGIGGLKALLVLSPPGIPRLHEAAFNGWVFAYSIVVTLATGVVFGFAPAWTASKVNLSEVLNAAGRGNSGGGRARSFSRLVAAETAIAVILLVGATLMLTLVGLYGVVAYGASQRTRELGIRMALGAQRFDLLALVIGQGMRPALAGLACGIAGAFGLTRFLTSQLYEISPTDPATLIGVSLVLAIVAILACWLPARRVTQLDPTFALRAD